MGMFFFFLNLNFVGPGWTVLISLPSFGAVLEEFEVADAIANVVAS